MMYKTHLALTVLITIIALQFLDYEPILFLLVALFATLVPDVDHSNSKLGRKVPFIGMIFTHRGLWHSVFPLFGFPYLISLYSVPMAVAFFLGYASHLLGDAVTEHGIFPFYPLKFRINGFLRTNTVGETMVYFLIIFLIGYILLPL